MPYIDYKRDGPIAVITLNRPEKLNALHSPMAQELAEAWLRYNQDADALVAILTGAGRAFCAGIDVAERRERAEKGLPGTSLSAVPVPNLYLQLSPEGVPGLLKPVIAAVNGLAYGIGCHLALAADLRVASPEASFSLAEVKIGLVGAGGRVMAQHIPMSIVMEMCLLGEPLDARRAYEVGLVNRLVPPQRLLPEALALAQRLAELPPLAV